MSTRFPKPASTPLAPGSAAFWPLVAAALKCTTLSCATAVSCTTQRRESLTGGLLTVPSQRVCIAAAVAPFSRLKIIIIIAAKTASGEACRGKIQAGSCIGAAAHRGAVCEDVAAD